MLLWFNLLGSKANINTASYRIMSILLKQNIVTKITSLDISRTSPIHWKSQIDQEFRSTGLLKTCAIVTKLGEVSDEDLRAINNYIREVGHSFAFPRAFYVIDRADKRIYMD